MGRWIFDRLRSKRRMRVLKESLHRAYRNGPAPFDKGSKSYGEIKIIESKQKM